MRVEVLVMQRPDNHPRVVYPSDDGSRVIADEQVQLDLARLARLREEARLLKFQTELVEVAILEYIRTASELLDAEGNLLATWKTPSPIQVFDLARFQTELPFLAAIYQTETVGGRRLIIGIKP
jgi:hypothetical protein